MGSFIIKADDGLRAAPYCGCRFLVAMTPFPELFVCAKHLFVEAMVNRLPPNGGCSSRGGWRNEAPAGGLASRPGYQERIDI
jgi:hypothetical protein